MRFLSAVLALLLPAVAEAQAYADLVFTNDFNNTGGFNQTCRNNGAGVFACALTTDNTDRRRGRGIAAADLDGDGDDDIAVATFGTGAVSATNRVCLNGGGAFTCADVSPDADFSKGVAAADLDGDGDVDLAFANASSAFGPALNRVCFNSGTGTFTCADVSPDLDESAAVVAADMDGDGDLDLAFGNDGAGASGAVNSVCLNSGAGVFTCAPVSADAGSTTGLTAADLDGDGDVDLVAANFFGRDRICLNSGTATFTCADVDSDGGDTYAVAAVDVDGDGDLDLAFANSILNSQGRTNRLCLNSGTATFTCASIAPDTDDSEAVVAADVDGDGDADLVFANEQFFNVGGLDRGQNRLCRNDGSGAFTCEDISGLNDDSYGVAVGNFGGMTVADDASVATTEALGLTAAPNPARGLATLTLTLDAAQSASVAVVDLLGRRVALLHDGPLSAGPHALQIDAAALPPGLYVVRATTATGATSLRLAVVR